ncbi:cation-transporting P-type ATPase, partial [Oleiphilus sp. HI0043]|uniref:cation-transporting P-type ATPase n=11 Tax=Oleiphilus TaxID=141450 RepID=UPI000A9C8741
MSTKWHTLNTEECAEALNSIIEKGLSKQEAQERLTTQGENILEQANTRPWWKVIMAQFQDVMIMVLLCAAAISGLVGEAV